MHLGRLEAGLELHDRDAIVQEFHRQPTDRLFTVKHVEDAVVREDAELHRLHLPASRELEKSLEVLARHGESHALLSL